MSPFHRPAVALLGASLSAIVTVIPAAVLFAVLTVVATGLVVVISALNLVYALVVLMRDWAGERIVWRGGTPIRSRPMDPLPPPLPGCRSAG